jgi:hypothetical protein
MNRSAIIGLTVFGAIAIPTAPAVAQKLAVTTYHYDNQRTGWNQQETKLTPANVAPTSFGVIAQVGLDDQVDAQPLLVPGQQVTAGSYTVTPTPGFYQVVYVATEGNTIYGIRASNGAVLLRRNLGTPVPTPLGCPSGTGPNVGITSTPVIDVAANALYVVAYTLMSGTPTYQLFALNLNDLTNIIAPVTVAASHTLSDGITTYNFNAQVEHQRPGLLLSFGNIYAGFGSFCDFSGSQSRGWLLGWNASNLAPLTANRLTDTQVTDASSFFLSAIWMSGYGIAAAPTSGSLFFSTGNSASGTYDGVTNIQESVVKLDPTLKTVLSLFTPYDVDTLDSNDEDVSAGGVLVVPPQHGLYPHLAVATSKSGTMYLLNRASLGGYTGPNGPDNVLAEQQIGLCWCGPTYFTGPDGVGRIVSSGGGTGYRSGIVANIAVWEIQTSPTTIALVKEGAAAPVASGQDGGTFTTVSSNRTQADTAIIWATGEPTGTGANPTAVNLYAFVAAPSSGTLPLLFSSQAGAWPSNANANIVPVVANGHVFVASYQQLTIFGLGGGPFVASAAAAAKPAALNAHAPPHAFTGILERADGPVLTLRTRAGKIARVVDSDAVRSGQIAVLVQGNAYTVEGTSYDSTGALRAQIVGPAKASPAIWPPDR